MISSAISTMVVVVRCPVSDPKPRPTRLIAERICAG